MCKVFLYKGKNMKKNFVLLLFITVVLLGNSVFAQQNDDSDKCKLKERVTKLETKVESLDKQVNDLKDLISNINNTLKNLSTDNNNLANKINNLGKGESIKQNVGTQECPKGTYWVKNTQEGNPAHNTTTYIWCRSLN